MYKLLLILFLSAICLKAEAQQQFIYTQYMFNGLAVNPAYAGTQEAISVTAFSRWQWAGFEGAPRTQTFSIHSPMPNNKVGLGFLATNDQIGVTSRQAIDLMYAYHIAFGKLRVSMGLQAGFTYYAENLDKLSLDNKSDNVFTQSAHVFLPNTGAGIFVYGDRGYVGFSIPELMNNRFDKNNQISTAKQKRHLFLQGGYVIKLNESLKLKPNILLKYVDGAPMEFDLNANLLIKERIWIGTSWRSFDSIDLLFQIQLSNKFQLGYAYDFPTTEIRKSTLGSHELLLNYRIKYKKDKVVSPRYF